MNNGSATQGLFNRDRGKWGLKLGRQKHHMWTQFKGFKGCCVPMKDS